MPKETQRALRLVTEAGSGVQVAGAVARYIKARRDAGEFNRLTATDTRYHLTRFAESCGDIPIANVRVHHIERWIASLDVAPTSLRTRLSCVRTFLRWCQARGWIDRDPTVGIRGPRVRTAPARNLSRSEVQAALACAPDARARLILLLMVQEGLRRAEVARLTFADLDRGDQLLKVIGKGEKTRFVPISDETLSALRAYVSEHPMSAGPIIRSYTHPRQGIGPSYVTGIVDRILRDAGVKHAAFDGVSAHAFRHTCANDMLDAGAEQRDVQEWLGHEQLSTTDRYTKRRRAARLRNAAEDRRYLDDPGTAA